MWLKSYIFLRTLQKDGWDFLTQPLNEVNPLTPQHNCLRFGDDQGALDNQGDIWCIY